jgi:O-antigen ligase
MTDPNLFAAALLTPISLILVLFLRTHNALKKLLWLAALLTLVYGFVATSSRGAAISFGVIVAFLLLRSRYAKQLSLIAALSAIVVFASPLAQRFMAPDLASADFRSDIWKVAFASLHQYWVLGAGFGNFDNAFAQYFLSVPHQPLFWQAASHSVLILAAVEGGITGLVLMLVLWYCMFRNLASIHADGLAKDICLGLRAAVLGLFVAGLSLDLMMEKYTWLLFALVVMVGSTLRADEQAQEPERAIPIPAAQHLMQPIGS